MTKKRYIETLLFSALNAFALLVVGCSDTDDSGMPPVIESEGEPLQVSRFTRYGAGDGTNETNYDNLTMWLFAIPTNNPAEKVQSGIVSFNGISEDDNLLTWNSAIYVKNSTTYEMFGFIPSYIAGTDSGISENGASSAKLTLKGLQSLSDDDVCIITGVVNGAPENLTPTDKLYRGVYEYQPLYGSTRYGVRLLADHIYASLKFGIYIDGDYDDRRTIKLKKMEVMSNQKAQVNAVIILNKGAGTEVGVPFTSFTTTSVESSDKASQVIFEDTEGHEIMTTAAVASMTDKQKAAYNMISPIYFGDWLKNDLYLVSTYDVYDKKGNLTRENCTVTNKLPSSKTNIDIGEQDSITLTVNPSYLYVLSDPDQDPKVVIK